jgi:hypothetical protein
MKASEATMAAATCGTRKNASGRKRQGSGNRAERAHGGLFVLAHDDVPL